MPVSIPLTSLSKHWPREKDVPYDKVDAASSEYRTGRYAPQSFGFPVYHTLPNLKKTTNHIYIPPKYCHALRFLNFKNSCYISILSIDRSEVDLRTKNGRTWATIRDGMSRQVIFNDAVRQSFFKEVRSFFQKGSQRPRLDDPSFRSINLDTWLIEEYLFHTHDPPSCKTLNRTEPYNTDPLKINWKKWAKDHEIPYFGSEIDQMMKKDFQRLRLAVLPTNETRDSNDVRAFQRLVAEYHASLNLHPPLDIEDDANAEGEPDSDGEEEREDKEEEEEPDVDPRRLRNRLQNRQGGELKQREEIVIKVEGLDKNERITIDAKEKKEQVAPMHEAPNKRKPENDLAHDLAISPTTDIRAPANKSARKGKVAKASSSSQRRQSRHASTHNVTKAEEQMVTQTSPIAAQEALRTLSNFLDEYLRQ